MTFNQSHHGPTLIEHFKQALNTNKTHLQNGPSALSSSAQMGLVNNTGPNIGAVSFGTGVGSNLGVGVGVDNNFGEIRGNDLKVGETITSPLISDNTSFLEKYGTWIFIICVGIALSLAGWYFYPVKNPSNLQLNDDKNNNIEKMISNRRAQKFSSPQQQPNGNVFALQTQDQPNFNDLVGRLPTFSQSSQFSYPNQQQQQYNQMTPLQPTYNQQQQQTGVQNPTKHDRTLREIEQPLNFRGAEFSNTSMSSFGRPSDLAISQRDNLRQTYQSLVPQQQQQPQNYSQPQQHQQPQNYVQPQPQQQQQPQNYVQPQPQQQQQPQNYVQPQPQQQQQPQNYVQPQPQPPQPPQQQTISPQNTDPNLTPI